MNSAVVGNLKVLLSLDTSNFDKGVTASEQNSKKLADRLAKDLIPNQQKINSLIRDFTGNREISNALQYATAVQQVGGATKLTAEHQAKANKAAMDALAVYRALGQTAPKEINDLAVSTAKLSKETTGLATATAKVKPAMAGMGDDVTMLAGKARALAGVFGVTLSAGALVSFAKGTFDAADKVVDLSNKMGVSIEAAQRFQFAARQSGADIEDVTQSIVKMNNNLAVGDKSTVQALAQAGLQFEDVRNMKPEDAFRAIADAIGKIPDPMIQSNVALELFGKSGATLLPMIRENSLKAADGARIMKESTVVALEAAKQAWENFWHDITAIVGDAIASILPQIQGMLRDVKTGFEFLARFQTSMQRGNSIGVSAMAAFGLGLADFRSDQAAEKAAELARLAGFEGVGDAQEVGAGMGLFGQAMPFKKDLRTKEQKDADAKAEKDKRDKERRDLEEHLKRIKAIRDDATGVDKINRIKELDAALKGLKPENLDDWSKWNKELNELVRSGERLTPFLETLRRSFDLPIAKTPLSTLMAGAFNPMGPKPADFVKFLPKEFANPALLNGINAAFATPAGTPQTVASASMLKGFASDLPNVILRTMTGGGDLTRSIGTLFGRDLGASFVKKNKLTGMLADFIPGVGALLGPGLDALVGWIGGIGKNKTLQGRQDFAKQIGFESLDNLHNKLASLGSEGQRLANISTNLIGRKDEAANRKWMADVTKFFDRLEKVPGKVSELSSALGKFGGLIPASQQGLLDSILGSGALSADLRKQLEGMQKPTWQAALEMASAFGVDPSKLGGQFNQDRLADSAFSLKRALDVFGKFAGSDQRAILKDMADEFSALALESRRSGVALPKAVQEFIRQVDEMGLLVDENGERIDSALLTFADIEDQAEKQIVDLLTQIRDLLKPAVDPGPRPGPGDPNNPIAGPRKPPVLAGPIDDGGGGDLSSMLPGFAGGTHGQFMDFGAGTPVMLHGREQIVTPNDRGFSDVPMMTFIQELDGRQVSRVVMPYVAGEVKRLGLIR